jgi:hypothetical protein
LFLFPELFGFVSDLESELDASMVEVFRLYSDCSCPSLPAFPLECHMTLFDTVGCIVKPLLIEGQEKHNAQYLLSKGYAIVWSLILLGACLGVPFMYFPSHHGLAFPTKKCT